VFLLIYTHYAHLNNPIVHRVKNLNDAPTPISTRPQTPPGPCTLETPHKNNKRKKKKVRHIYCLACTDALTKYHTQVQKAENSTTEATIPPEGVSPKRGSIRGPPAQPGQVSCEGGVGRPCYSAMFSRRNSISARIICKKNVRGTHAQTITIPNW